ncbi:ABC transporter permease [Candidatus Woesearchaeota archaeon]|nr:ABC transporter permease [Candidatus Woesearchaeota archaeon]
MGKILKIISKNFKLLFRSRTSALIVILGPLIIILLVGMAFNNTSQYNLKIGVYSQNFNELSNSFVSKLSQDNYHVTKYDTEEICIKEIKLGNIHSCLIFPPDFEIKDGKENIIEIHIDYSKVNLAWMIRETLTEQVKERASELTLDMTNDLVTQLKFTEEQISGYNSKLDELITDKNSIDTFKGSVNEVLDGLDLNFNKGEFKVDDVKKSSSSIQTKIKNIIKNINNSLEEAEDEIDSAISKVGHLNINASDEDDVTDKLDDALDDINYSRIKLGEAIDSDNFEQINTVLGDISSKLDSVSSKLTKAGEGRTQIKTKLESIKKLVDSSKVKISDIKDVNSKILNAINGIDIGDASTIVSPIKTDIKTVIPEKTHLNYMIPALIVLIIMFVSILLSSTLVLMEKNTRAFFRNFVTPTNSVTFVLGTYLTALIMIFVQTIIIGFIYYGLFLNEFSSSIIIASLILVLIISLFTLVGMLIGYLFNSEETATIASICVGSLFLFLSDILLPLESMPETARQFVQYNPFLLASETLKKILLFDQPISTVTLSLGYLAGYSILLFILIIALQSFVKKSFLFHYALKFMPRKHVRDPLVQPTKTILDKESANPIQLYNGKTAMTFLGLIKELELMSDKDFKKHVTKKNNDFANWIEQELGLRSVAIAIESIRDRKKMIKKLSDFIK